MCGKWHVGLLLVILLPAVMEFAPDFCDSAGMASASAVNPYRRPQNGSDYPPQTGNQHPRHGLPPIAERNRPKEVAGRRF